MNLATLKLVAREAGYELVSHYSGAKRGRVVGLWTHEPHPLDCVLDIVAVFLDQEVEWPVAWTADPADIENAFRERDSELSDLIDMLRGARVAVESSARGRLVLWDEMRWED